MGPSGSGKSTLMHCLAGLDSATGGSVFIGDVDLTTLERQAADPAAPRRPVGFVFQAYNLLPTLTALENITLPMDIAGRKPDQEWLDTVIDTIGLRDRLNHRPTELSGGQQQRVACARALASRPDIVFADEPTGNLDSRSGAEVLGFLRRSVRDIGQTVVMVTHDPAAASYADRVLFLADGRIVDEMADPTADLVLERMKRLESSHEPPSPRREASRCPPTRPGGRDLVLRVIVKNLLARKLRLVLTALSVVLGVAFVDGDVGPRRHHELNVRQALLHRLRGHRRRRPRQGRLRGQHHRWWRPGAVPAACSGQRSRSGARGRRRARGRGRLHRLRADRQA